VFSLVLPGVFLAACVAAALTGVESHADFGLPNPGALTTYGLPVARVLADVGAVLTVGALLFASFLATSPVKGTVAPDAFAALRFASGSAGVWFVGATAMVPLTTANVRGVPVTEVLDVGELVGAIGIVEQVGSWVLTAVVAAVLIFGTRSALSWGWSVVLFGIALFGLMPVAVTGHSATGGSHDLATNSLILHLVAACLWVGGLVALLAHARRRGEQLAVSTVRFSSVAFVCWLVMAVSGVVNAAVRVSASDLFSTYGWLVMAKVGALLLLGCVGYAQRERVVRAVVAGAGRSKLVRLGAVELLLMFATVGLAVGLGRTPPPGSVTVLSSSRVLLGYELDGAPTLTTLLFEWRFDLLFGSAALLGMIVYLIAVRRLTARGDTWPVGRTVAWVIGCVVVLVATSSGVGRYAPAMFSVHMGAHMLLSMLAPILLVLGGPAMLALRVLPPAGRGAPPGPREWLLAVVHSPMAKVLTHPLVTLPLFVGSFYGLYFSGLFDLVLRQHWAHLAMNAHFLLVGCLFFWPIIGVDPAPRRLAPLAKLGLVFASTPFHAFFGVALMNTRVVIGADFYNSLALPWVPNALADQRVGGGLAWASGELPMLIVIIALMIQWAGQDERAARRHDRRADSDGDADLVAYNAMLSEMSGKAD
jgi:putative copper resistance protein D